MFSVGILELESVCWSEKISMTRGTMARARLPCERRIWVGLVG